MYDFRKSSESGGSASGPSFTWRNLHMGPKLQTARTRSRREGQYDDSSFLHPSQPPLTPQPVVHAFLLFNVGCVLEGALGTQLAFKPMPVQPQHDE